MSPDQKTLAFDIETAKVLPEGVQDLLAHRPLGISCAATITSDGFIQRWYGKQTDGTPAPQMSVEAAGELVQYLAESVEKGYQIVTWNGLGFDFDILAEESGEIEICKQLALDHIDMMFHVFCLNGYGLSLAKAAAGMGVAGKHKGMPGSLVPKYWQAGRHDEILDYVVQDVRMTLTLFEAGNRRRALRWISNRGVAQFLPLPHGWVSVRKALEHPEPDTSWMRNPWRREKFAGWLFRA